MTSAASPEKTEAISVVDAVNWAREDGYVLVRHMCRSPLTRTKRAARAGHRRQGVVLAHGKRIRKRSRRQLDVVGLAELIAGAERVLEYVRVGTLEVCDPRTITVIPYEMLPALLCPGAAVQPAPPPASKPPPPPAAEGYTEEELEKKTRGELNKIAMEFGIKEPDRLPNKPAVIDAIFTASTGEE